MSLAAKLCAAALPAVQHTEGLSHTGSKRHERPGRKIKKKKRKNIFAVKNSSFAQIHFKKQATSGQEGFIKQT